MQPAGAGMDIRRFMGILYRRRYIVALTVLASFGASFFFKPAREPVYEAQASVEIKGQFEKEMGFVEYSAAAEAQGQVQVVQSFPLLTEALKKVGVIPPDIGWETVSSSEQWLGLLTDLRGKLKVSRVENSAILTLTVVDPSPPRARDLANAVAQAYVEYYSQSSQKSNEEVLKFVRGQKQELARSLDDAQRKLNEFKLQNNFLSLQPQIAAAVAGHEALIRQKESLEVKRAQTATALNTLDKGAVTLQMLEELRIRKIDPDLAAAENDIRASLREVIDLSNDQTPNHPSVKSAMGRLENSRRSLVQSLEGLLRSLLEDDARLEEQIQRYREQNRALLDLESQLYKLEKEVTVIEEMSIFLEKEYQENRIKSAYTVSRAEIIQPAILPRTPRFGKQQVRPQLVAVILGLIVGIGLALVRESFDFSLTNILDIEALLGSIVLGVVPYYQPEPGSGEGEDAESRNRRAYWVVHTEPKATISESFRSLRTRLLREFGRNRMIMVCSATPQEGKSMISMGLTLAFAQTGLRAIYVECNMRRPVLAKTLGLKEVDGLRSVIHEGRLWSEAALGVSDLFAQGISSKMLTSGPGLDYFRIIPSGGIDAHPAESLEQLIATSFFDDLRAQFDVVIVDTPPVMAVADATIVGQKADVAILVYRAGRAPRETLQRCVQVLRDHRINLAGVLVNAIDLKGMSSQYYYYQRYTYGAPAPLRKRRGGAWGLRRRKTERPTVSRANGSAV